MNRLIPGKTRVSVELFRGVRIGDIAVAAFAAAMVILVLLSSLPWKLPICIAVALVAALLVIRLDERPNYLYLLHILRHLGYDRRFARRYSDRMLLDRAAGEGEEAAFNELFAQKEEEKERETKAERRAREKERARERREEDRLLKSKSVDEAEKEAIRARRDEESRQLMRRIAEAKDAAAHRKAMNAIIPFTGIQNGYIEYGKEYYGGVIEIDPVEFRFFSELRRRSSIEQGLGRTLRSLHGRYSANIVKLERPVNYDGYLERELEKLEQLRRSYENAMLTEEEYKIRVEVQYDRINAINEINGADKIITPFYYLCLFESDKKQLDLLLDDALTNLRQGELTARRLNDRELAMFLKYSNQLDFEEREVDAIRPEDYAEWAMPNVVDVKARRVEINHIITHNFRVVKYPTVVGDAWLASVLSMPATKVVVKCRQMDRDKAIRSIDRSLMELRGQWSATGVDSRRMEIESNLGTLQELLEMLQSDSETLLECNVYVTAYDISATRGDLRIPQPPPSELTTISEMKKTVRRTWQEEGFRLNNLEFNQMQAFIGSQISALDPLAREGRGIPSNTVAASFPWVFAHVSDEGGIKLGTSGGVPVFINFFRRDAERVNSNMVIVGKSGSGKSYATKSLLTNLAAEDAKIFILDPENEYTELAANLHGKFINVGNAQQGRLNPFHIITALDDDEAGEDAPSGSFATHLQFLEEFFRQILPDCDKDAMEYLNSIVERLYANFDITPATNLSRLTPEDYPIFDDLYDLIMVEFQKTDNQYIRTILRTLMNHVAKFSAGGRNSNIWNGPSTVTTDENFTVFNFQSMLANRNTTIANAQMLLVLKYIDNEIIKNRDYNTKYGLQRKIVVVIDEAHVFIDNKFPIALDFMFQLAKRIRKYNGMQIVITQNIKDFVGSEDIARKSTAIINACQYSFIFSLAPNDMSDLVKLYSNAGGINESEQEQIIQAPRGQAFTIMSPTSRSFFRVDTPEGMRELFRSRAYVSRYFSGEEGEAAWEEYVADSRPLHDEAAAARRKQEREDAEDAVAAHQNVVIEEYEGDEFDEEEANIRIGGDDSGVSISFEEEDETTPVRLPEPELPPVGAPIGLETAALGQTFSTLVEKLTDAVGRLSMEDIRLEARRAVEEQIKAELSRLQLDRLAPAADTAPAPAAAGSWDDLFAPAAQPETAQSESDWDELFAPAAATAPTAEPAPAPAPESAPQPTSVGSEWLDLFPSGDAETATPSAEQDVWGGVFARAEETSAAEQNALLADDTYEENPISPMDADDFFARSIMLAQSLTPVERMNASGQTVMDITMEDLEKLIGATRQQKTA